MTRRFLPRTLRWVLQLLILAAIAPGFIFAIYGSAEQYRRAERRAYETVERATRLAVREHETLVETTRTVLEVAIARTSGLDPGEMCQAFPGMLPAAQWAVLVSVHRASPAYEILCDASRDGLGVDRLPTAAERAISAAASTGAFAAGGYTLSPGGESRLAVAQPMAIRSQHGWYLVAFVPLDWFGVLAANLQLPDNSAMTIVGPGTVVLARYPDPQAWVGRVIAQGHRLGQLSSAGNGGAFESEGFDGVRRLYAYAHLAHGGSDGSYLVVGVPSASVFRAARQALIWNVVGLLGVSVIGLLLGRQVAERHVLRKVQALTSAADRIAAGDLSARTGETGGTEEMHTLARAFDQMAGSMEQSRRNLDRLSQELLRVQEKERQHIARELHDEIGQSLTALKINLQIEQGGRAESPFLAESVGIVDRLLTEIRQLALTLRPPLLQEQGLRSAVGYLLRAESERSGLRTVNHISIGDARYPHEIELAVFRVVQEAVTNVTRHAKANSIVVSLDEADGALRLTIEDDGAGFDASPRGGASGGFGLLSMYERAELIGGHLDIDSAPGMGTRIGARFPLPPPGAPGI
jgi:signal transduction histidine kinase